MWEGVCGGAEIFGSPFLYNQRAVFASPLSAVFIVLSVAAAAAAAEVNDDDGGVTGAKCLQVVAVFST